jgi:hypothetical protein
MDNHLQRTVQLLIRGYRRASETSALLVAATTGLHRVLRLDRLGFHLQLSESGQDLSPSQRHQGFIW